MKAIPFAKPDMTEREVEAVSTVIRSGMLASGNTVTEFEERFARSVGAKHAIAVGSCTQGFMLLFEALRVRNRRVLTPTYTFTGPAMMAHKLGAAVELLDCAENQFVPGDHEYSEPAKFGGVHIAMPVHFAGRAVSPHRVKLMTGGAWVLDDAAHALGARLGRPVGSLAGADATVFSFYATKALCTGNGGMVTTEHDDLAQELRSIRLHGFSKDLRSRYDSPGASWEYDVVRPGWKANMTDMAAAMGIIQLDRLVEMQHKRWMIARAYREAFSQTPGMDLPYPEDDCDHAWHLFPILLTDRAHRDRVCASLTERKIGTSVHFIPLHHHSAWKDAIGEVRCPQADRMFERTLSLPIYSSMTDADVARVIQDTTQVLKETAPC